MSMRSWLVPLLTLAACAPERPDGAYTPTYTNIGPKMECRPGFECGDAGEEMPDDVDANVEETPDPETDAGQEPPPDTGPIEAEPDDPLRGLVGRYLMRMDYYSIATESQLGTTLTLNNRVSNLYYTELRSVNGALEATEKFCFQNSAHKCVAGCSGWTTTYPDRVLNPQYRMMKPVVRTYAIDGTKLTAPRALMPLGFTDEQNPSNLPTSVSDARVWKLTTAINTSRAIPTVLTGRLGGTVSMDCEVDSVMVFGTAFSVQLAALDELSLAGSLIDIDPNGTKAYPVVADGVPATLPKFCDLPTLQGQADKTGRDESGYVRFLKLNDTAPAGCPTSKEEFESRFPISERERTEVLAPQR